MATSKEHFSPSIVFPLLRMLPSLLALGSDLLVFTVAFLKTQEKKQDSSAPESPADFLVPFPLFPLNPVAIPDTPGTYRSPAMLTLISKLVHPMALRGGSLGMKLNGMGKKNYFLLVGFHEAIQELQAIHSIMINCAFRFQ